ncbi:MAG: CAP domain-containing protein [bacterium]|nr:CAP domain-containing protein [bacterium]
MLWHKCALFFLNIILLSLFQVAQATNSKFTEDTLQNEILSHINQYRKQHHLPMLQMNSYMVKEAKQHSIDMATHKIPFGHQYFIKRINRLNAQIKNSGGGAENVAYNYKDAEDVVNNWLRSPGHKRNIDGNYDLTGVGVAYDKKGQIYFTQIFLKTGKKNLQKRKSVTTMFNHSFF